MSSKISIANASLFPHIVSMLNAGHTVKLLLRGNSMRPYLVHERDYALLSRVGQKTLANGQSVPDIKVGDVILAEVAPGHYVLHRLISIEGNHITLLGDGNLNPEHCTLADVRGRAYAFIRKGSDSQENVTSLKYRIYRTFWMHTRPLRRYMLGIHNILFSSRKNI